MIICVSLFVALVGLVLYFVTTNPKLARVSEIMLAAGLLAFLIRIAEMPQFKNG